MNASTKRIVATAGVLLTVMLLGAGWATVKVVAWARELPNRVVIESEGIANAFGHASTEAYHQALRDGDTVVQLRVLNEQFEPLVGKHTDGASWISREFGEDIRALVDSSDPDVSAAAANLLIMLGSSPQFPEEF